MCKRTRKYSVEQEKSFLAGHQKGAIEGRELGQREGMINLLTHLLENRIIYYSHPGDAFGDGPDRRFMSQPDQHKIQKEIDKIMQEKV